MKKVEKRIYEQIKKEYLEKSNATSLYMKFHKDYNLTKIQFYQIIEKIRTEENLPPKVMKKTKRTSNPFSYHDKHPDSYLESANMIS